LGVVILVGGLISLKVSLLGYTVGALRHSPTSPRRPPSAALASSQVEVGPVLRPKVGRAFLVRSVIGLIPLSALVVVIASPVSVIGTWIIVGALVTAGTAAMLVAVRTSRLSWDASGLTWVDIFGRERRFASSTIAAARRYCIADLLGRRPYLSFLGRDGAELFRPGSVSKGRGGA
jgi:hypothetical protein